MKRYERRKHGNVEEVAAYGGADWRSVQRWGVVKTVMQVWVPKSGPFLAQFVYRRTDRRARLTWLPTFAKYKVIFLELSLFIVEDKYALAAWHTLSFSLRLN